VSGDDPLDDFPLLIFKEAKALLCCSDSVLLDGIRAGFVPAFKLGHTWRFYRSRLTALMDEWGDDPSGWVTAMKQQQGVREVQGWPMGTIYAVETAPGRVKLGYTTNLPMRLHSIEGHAGQAVLLRSEPGTSRDEKRLHDECAAQHIRREHFRNEGRVAEYVAGMFSAHDSPHKVSP